MKLDIDDQHNIVLSEVYEGVVVRTEVGVFGVCERDGGLEVTFQGQLVFSKYPEPMRFGPPLCIECKRPIAIEEFRCGDSRCLKCRGGGEGG